MVDVLIGEMVGSDRSPPERLQRAFGAECQRSSTRPKWRCSQRRSGRVATTELTEPTLLEIARYSGQDSVSNVLEILNHQPSLRTFLATPETDIPPLQYRVPRVFSI